jgi:hypothetical protein
MTTILRERSARNHPLRHQNASELTHAATSKLPLSTGSDAASNRAPVAIALCRTVSLERFGAGSLERSQFATQSGALTHELEDVIALAGTR